MVAGTAHEAYLKALFTEAELHAYPDDGCARGWRCDAARSTFMFGDAHFARVLAQRHRTRPNCCAFSGGPFIDSRYFGEGIGIAVRTRQRHVAAGAQLGAVPALGEGPFHRSVAALFSDQSVLSRHSGAREPTRIYSGLTLRIASNDGHFIG